MSQRQKIQSAKRLVIKIGSALLTNDGKGLDKPAIAAWVEQMASLRKQGREVILVSSGSVAEGMTRLGWQVRPKALHDLQAAAAVGQMGLVQAYETEFQKYDYHTAQILLVHEDLSNRQRYLNARTTLQTLLDLEVIPVVNENDTVANEEIRFGDNDTLAALVANLVDADALLILTDQEGLYDADPRSNPDAAFVHVMKAGDAQLKTMAGGSGTLGRGGMATKVKAAELASRSGTDTVIAGGRQPGVIEKVFAGDDIGTLLYCERAPLEARKRWLAGLKPRGSLSLDAGAAKALKKGGVSLLPIGVTELTGDFDVGDMLVCLDPEGEVIARGLINYAAADAQKILGLPSGKLPEALGYQAEPELIHCDNMVLSD